MTCCSTRQCDDVQPSDSGSNQDEKLDWDRIPENVGVSQDGSWKGFHNSTTSTTFGISVINIMLRKRSGNYRNHY